MSQSTIPPGPWSWQGDDKYVGQSAQNIYNFLQKLWSDVSSISKPLRDALSNIESETDIRNFAKDNLYITIPKEVRLILVDIQESKTKPYNPQINPATDPFYVLVIPPKPSRINTKDYKDAQALSEAWFHATTDGWGM
jgi:hypothetical protein